VALAVAWTSCAPDDRREPVTIGGERFRLEVVADPEGRRRGLMERTSLEPDGGMLFVFPESRLRSFWMGHCLIDIDLIFLDAGARVTAMHAMRAEAPQGANESDAAYRQRLPGYWSDAPAQYAIELAGGTLERLPLGVGDRIDLDTGRLAARAR
jgi:uncharacterized membrane protein (UPF0127 family)